MQIGRIRLWMNDFRSKFIHKNRNYQFFIAIILASLILAMLLLIASLFGLSAIPFPFSLFIILVSLLSLSVTKANIHWSIHIFLLGTWIINLAASAFWFGGISSPTLGMYLFQIILAAFTLDKRSTIFYSGLVLSAVTGLFVAGLLNLVPSVMPSLAIFHFLVNIIIFSICSIIMVQMVLSLADSYNQASNHAIELEKKNQELAAAQVALQKQVFEHMDELTRQKIIFESLVNNIPLAIVTLDDKNQIISCNRSFYKLFEYSQEEVLGQNLDDLVTTYETYDEAVGYTNRILSGETIFVDDAKRRTKSGKIVYVDIYGVPMVLNHQWVGQMGLYVDSTERKKVEEALLESENRYRSLFEDSPISLWEENFGELKAYMDTLSDSGVMDFESYFHNHPEDVQHCASLVEITHINQATRDLLELPGEWREKLPSVFTEESLAVFREELISLSRGNTSFRGEINHRTTTGKTIFAMLRLVIAPGYEHNWKKVFVSLVDITERRNVEMRLHYLSTHDNLTGLPNRFLLYDRLNHALSISERTGTKVAALFVDLDRFKIINDTHGHLKGDMLLRSIASRMISVVRESDTVARLGGDEFVIILEGIHQASDASEVAQKTFQSLNEPYLIESTNMSISSSIGICLYPDNAKNFDEMIKFSDAAMYQAKIHHTHVEFYSAAQPTGESSTPFTP